MTNSYSNWAGIANAIIPASEEAVDATAKAAVANIRGQIEANGQVRSGEMRDSVHSISQRGSTYQSSEHALPEMPAPDSSTEADVAVAASYAVFPNYGTVFQSGHAFFEPGMDATRADFDHALEGVAKKLEEAGR
jgi:bacteriophage HK97-gp10 putative tail-component